MTAHIIHNACHPQLSTARKWVFLADRHWNLLRLYVLASAKPAAANEFMAMVFSYLANAEKSDFLMPRHEICERVRSSSTKRATCSSVLHSLLNVVLLLSANIRVYKWCCIISHNIIPKVNQMSLSPRNITPKHNISNPRTWGQTLFQGACWMYSSFLWDISAAVCFVGYCAYAALSLANRNAYWIKRPKHEPLEVAYLASI